MSTIKKIIKVLLPDDFLLSYRKSQKVRIEKSIQRVLKKKAVSGQIRALSGGKTSSVFFIEGSKNFVIKKVKDNELNLLTFLKDKNFTPQIVDILYDKPHKYLLMEYVYGNALATILNNNFSFDEVRNIYKLLATTLAKDIHSIKYDPNNKYINKWTYTKSQFDTNCFYTGEIKASIDYYLNIDINDISDIKTLIHGDLHLYNIMYSQERLTIIDWNAAGWGNPVIDFANIVISSYHWFPSSISKELLKVFFDTYFSYTQFKITNEMLIAAIVQKIYQSLSFLIINAANEHDLIKEFSKRDEVLKIILESNFFD